MKNSIANNRLARLRAATASGGHVYFAWRGSPGHVKWITFEPVLSDPKISPEMSARQLIVGEVVPRNDIRTHLQAPSLKMASKKVRAIAALRFTLGLRLSCSHVAFMEV